MVIYAPTSSVTVQAAMFDGALIGDNVSLTAGTITEDLDLGNYPLYNGVSVFRPAQYG